MVVDYTEAELEGLLPFDAIARPYPDYPKGGFIPPGLLDPNYVPPSRVAHVLVSTIVFLTLATVTVAIRLISTYLTPGLTLGWEGRMMLPALMFVALYSALNITGLQRGCFARHAYDCKPQEIALSWSLNIPLMEVYILGMYFIKLSNLFFLRRITPNHMRKMHRMIIGFFVFNLLWTLTAASVNLATCSPIKVGWDIYAKLKPFKCVNLTAVALWTNGIFLVSDVLFLILPITISLRLKLPLRTRMGIAFLFFLGVGVCATCAVKIYTFRKFYKSFDSSWSATDLLIWSQAELSLALIVVTLPTIDFVLVKLIPKRLRDYVEQVEQKYTSDGSSGEKRAERQRVLDADKLNFTTMLDPETKKMSENGLISNFNTVEGGKSVQKAIKNKKEFDALNSFESSDLEVAKKSKSKKRSRKLKMKSQEPTRDSHQISSTSTTQIESGAIVLNHVTSTPGATRYSKTEPEKSNIFDIETKTTGLPTIPGTARTTESETIIVGYSARSNDGHLDDSDDDRINPQTSWFLD